MSSPSFLFSVAPSLQTEEGLKQHRSELKLGGWQNQDYKTGSAMQCEEFQGNSIDNSWIMNWRI